MRKLKSTELLLRQDDLGKHRPKQLPMFLAVPVGQQFSPTPWGLEYEHLSWFNLTKY